MKPNDSIILRLRQALTQADTDYCEIRFEHSNDLEITFQSSGLERVSKSELFGGNVRALSQGGWGFAVFNDLDDLEQSLQSACSQAKTAGAQLRQASKLAPVPVVEDDVRPHWTLHPNAIDLAEKIRIMEHYHRLALGYSFIVSARSFYKERCGTHWFANSEGTAIRQEKMEMTYYLLPTGKQKEITVTDGYVVESARGFDALLNQDHKVHETCMLIQQLLEAPSAQSGIYTVICSPEVAGTFVHESFGHLSEADEIIKNPVYLKAMQLGRQFGKSIVNIYDSGEFTSHLGGLIYDDEGVASQRTYLVKEGKLVGRLHNRVSAAALGESATGSARAIDFTYPPLVRMRCTAFEAGENSFEEMLQGIEHGIYLVGNSGGQTDGESFTFAVSYGYMIRKGKISELVRDLRFSGNVFATMANIDMIGNDPKLRGSNCGKWEQNNLSIGINTPHIRIQNANIGGVQ